jgi:hypothetical protein
MKLIRVIYHENCYGQFYLPSLNGHNNKRLPLIRQFFFISCRINMFIYQIVMFRLNLEAVLPEGT